MNRRGFLSGILAAAVAPAIVRAASLMPVKSLESGLLVLEEEPIFTDAAARLVAGGNTLLTIDMITKEAMQILNHKIGFYGTINRQFGAAAL